MPEEESIKKYVLTEGDKVSSVMIYTASQLILGDVITKEAVRVSTWLRTAAIPKFITVHEAKVINFFGVTHKPQQFLELHLPSSQVVAFHLRPPIQDPLDYDPNEPSRKLEPTSVLVGTFLFEGFTRMSTHTTLERYLDVAKETFGSLYDVQITQPALAGMGVIRVPFVLLRSESVIYSPRQVG